jgi:hypothetical protein
MFKVYFIAVSMKAVTDSAYFKKAANAIMSGSPISASSPLDGFLKPLVIIIFSQIHSIVSSNFKKSISMAISGFWKLLF